MAMLNNQRVIYSICRSSYTGTSRSCPHGDLFALKWLVDAGWVQHHPILQHHNLSQPVHICDWLRFPKRFPGLIETHTNPNYWDFWLQKSTCISCKEETAFQPWPSNPFTFATCVKAMRTFYAPLCSKHGKLSKSKSKLFRLPILQGTVMGLVHPTNSHNIQWAFLLGCTVHPHCWCPLSPPTLTAMGLLWDYGILVLIRYQHTTFAARWSTPAPRRTDPMRASGPRRQWWKSRRWKIFSADTEFPREISWWLRANGNFDGRNLCLVTLEHVERCGKNMDIYIYNVIPVVLFLLYCEILRSWCIVLPGKQINQQNQLPSNSRYSCSSHGKQMWTQR